MKNPTKYPSQLGCYLCVLVSVTWHIPLKTAINIQADDEAIYIGTLQIKRNDVYEILSMQFKDDMQKDQAAIAAIAPSLKVRKALLKIKQNVIKGGVK